MTYDLFDVALGVPPELHATLTEACEGKLVTPKDLFLWDTPEGETPVEYYEALPEEELAELVQTVHEYHTFLVEEYGGDDE